MDKTFLVFMAIGIGGMYFLTNFIGDIQEEDDRLKNNQYSIEHKYDKYHSYDSIGRDILDVSQAPSDEQIGAWNNSMLKDEFTQNFPNFDEMKTFISERIRGEILINTLTQRLEEIENKFFSGTINPEQAKKELSTLY